MPRFNRKSELFSHVSRVGVFRDAAGGGNSTVATTLPTVDTLGVLNVVSGTNFLANDWYRVRDGDKQPEIGKVASITTNAITPLYRHAFAPAVGDAVVEQNQVDLGHIDGAVSVTMSGGFNDVASAVRRLKLGYLIANLKLEVGFSVLGYNLNNFLAALGMVDTDSAGNIAGAGTTGSPWRTMIDGTKIKEQNDLCWFIDGVQKDGSTLSLQLWGCELDFTGLSTALKRGDKGVIPFKLAPTSAIRFLEID
jgi:hypothetical protein